MPSSPTTEASIFDHAFWIWPEKPNWDIVNCYALFRHGFRLSVVPAKAPFFITADQSYQLYVNDHFVARGPARGFQTSWPYDEIDLKPYLKKGYNQIAVRAYNPGFSNFQYLCQGMAGLLVAARWGKVAINSDSGWKTIRQAGIRRDAVPTSLQLFPQEHIDLRCEPDDWTSSGFDDHAWASPTMRQWDGAPWFSLEPRAMPLLEEREVVPIALIGSRKGKSALDYGDTRNVVALRQEEDRSHQPAGAAAGAFKPLIIAATKRGYFCSYLFDFGRTVVGSLKLSIPVAHGGEIIDTHYSETIDAATLTPDQVMDANSKMAFGDRMILRAGKNTHPFFHPYGFRYLMITVRDAVRGMELGLTLQWIGYPLERKGAFNSSDPALERIWETSAWTQQCCSLDAYVDTPWREQAQWWGDARVQAWNTFHLNGDARLFLRGIRQIAGQTTPDGVTYGHAPTMAHNCILPDFTLIWFLTLWDYYWQTESTEPFTQHAAVIERALAYFHGHTDAKTGLVTGDARYWLFLDWTDLFKDGAPAVYNLWLLISLEKLALLYRKTRQRPAAVALEAWAANLRSALEKLVNRDGLMCDGIDIRGRAISETSIHSQTLAIMAGIKGLDTTAAINRIILPWIRGESSPKATPSAYWATYVFTVLTDHGYGREVLAFIRKHWLPMADYGTTWENFAPRRGDESHSHAWSAHPLYHLMQTVGGVTQMAVAWKEVRFSPVLEGDHGGATIPTPAGKITSLWKRTKTGAIDVSLSLPKGISAQVILPGVRADHITGRHRWTVFV